MADISVKLREKIAELENIIEGQQQHIAMLQNDLYNEQLRNSNPLVRHSEKVVSKK